MLEINKQNIDEIVRLEKYDLEVSAKWILNARSDNARIRVPETHEERLQYINDWLSVCPKGTNAKIQEYKNYIFNLAKTKNIKFIDNFYYKQKWKKRFSFYTFYVYGR